MNEKAKRPQARKRVALTGKTGNTTLDREPMDVGCVIEQTRHVDQVLHGRIVGQDDVLETIVCSFSRILSGLRDPSRPMLNLLMLGPTGTGKSETAKALVIQHGSGVRFGARPLRRAIESDIVDPLSRLVASCLVQPGDVIEISLRNESLAFYRGSPTKGALVA
jgi:ATP-dependent Clp protease ATP-binding subunit ClpA